MVFYCEDIKKKEVSKFEEDLKNNKGKGFNMLGGCGGAGDGAGVRKAYQTNCESLFVLTGCVPLKVS